MPKEYAELYSELVSAKVTFPRERRYLDWPQQQNPSALLASAALESGDEDEPESNSQIRNNPPSRVNPGNLPVNQDRSSPGQSSNMNGGDQLQQLGDLPTKVKELKTVRTKVAEMILANPGHPSRLILIEIWREKQQTTRGHSTQ